MDIAHLASVLLPVCTSFRYAVALAPGAPADYEVAAELCVPQDSPRDTVLLTVHGATYSSVYWDFPYRPDRYSFVRYANAAGYATLNFDRIGTGDSDRPPSLQVTPTAQAYVHHQLAEALRSGELGHAWSRVVLVGHSLGSIISVQQAATYHDVDGVVVTGFLHTYGPGLPQLLLNIHPAALDPSFAGSGLDLGYLTTRPGTRGPTFYYLPNADPAVIALDEATKGLGTSGELAEFALVNTALTSLQVDAPVLTVVGRHDTVFCGIAPCGTLLSGTTLEPAAYAPAAELEIVVVPNAGHDLNLQINAPTAYAAIRGWLDERFPPLGD
ncbi:alpha/beta hydrolase [Sorangium sp. So ce861]|uniref:alpha/beta hydrolase n=1 Tax=Sorangium sp. So ce861 TaxID=3133323 RepID=UPI003F6350E1